MLINTVCVKTRDYLGGNAHHQRSFLAHYVLIAALRLILILFVA